MPAFGVPQASSRCYLVVIVVMVVIAVTVMILVPVMALIGLIVTPLPVCFLVIFVQLLVGTVGPMIDDDPLVIFNVLIVVPRMVVVVVGVVNTPVLRAGGS